MQRSNHAPTPDGADCCLPFDKFKHVKMGDEKLLALRASLDRLQKQGHEFWIDGHSRWTSKVRVAEWNGLLLVYVYRPFSRPTLSQLALLTPNNRVLFPGMSPADFVEFVQISGIEDLQTIAALQEFAWRSYGVSEKGSMPCQIATESDAAALGVKLSPNALALDSRVTLWWQEWAGELFTFAWDPNATPPVVEKKPLNRLTGNYRPGGYPQR